MVKIRLLELCSGVARPSAARGRPYKCRPFHPSNLHARSKDEQSILKITIKHSQTEMGLEFHCRLWVLLFLLVVTFVITFSIFCYLCICMYRPDMFEFSSLLILISGTWIFNSLLIPEDQMKKIRDAMAAYLLCRC